MTPGRAVGEAQSWLVDSVNAQDGDVMGWVEDNHDGDSGSSVVGRHS